MDLKSIKVRKLVGGESERLTQNYWEVKSVISNYKSTVDDVYNCWKEKLPKLSDDELVYLYWELAFNTQNRNKENVNLMKILVTRVYKERIYERSKNK